MEWWGSSYAFGQLWTFADTTTTAWHDSSDPQTVTTVSGGVSQITDKSGNGYTLTQATAGARPTYLSAAVNGLNAMSFDGGDTLQAASAADWKFLHDATGSTVFLVVRANSPTSATMTLLATAIASSTSTGYLLSASTSNEIEHLIYRGVSGAPSVNNISNLDNFPRDALYVISILCNPGDATAANRSAISINGNTPIRLNTQVSAPSTSNPAGPLTLGGATNATGRLTGLVCESVIISGLASQDILDRGVGRLSHKWGLSGSLPANHPYKSAPPTI